MWHSRECYRGCVPDNAADKEGLPSATGRTHTANLTAVVDLAQSRDPGRADKVRPEVLAHMLDRVDPDCVDVELAYEVAHPPMQKGDDLGQLGVQVRHVVGEPA